MWADFAKSFFWGAVVYYASKNVGVGLTNIGTSINNAMVMLLKEARDARVNRR